MLAGSILLLVVLMGLCMANKSMTIFEQRKTVGLGPTLYYTAPRAVRHVRDKRSGCVLQITHKCLRQSLQYFTLTLKVGKTNVVGRMSDCSWRALRTASTQVCGCAAMYT